MIAAEYPLVLTLYKPFSRDYRGDRNLRVFDNRLPFVSNLNVIRADESLDNNHFLDDRSLRLIK